MSRKHLKVRIVDPDGKITRVRLTIPKRYRKSQLDEWRGLTDAYTSGVADGVAQTVDLYSRPSAR